MSSVILYIGNFGDMRSAAFTRVYNISKLLNNNNIKVVICSCNTGYITVIPPESTNISSTNISNYHFNKPSNAILSLKELLTNNQAFSFIEECINDFHPDRLIVYNGLYSLSSKLLKLAEKKDFTIYSDSTEWYEFSPMYHFNDFVFARSVDKRIRELDKKMSGAIAISNFFYDYYEKIGVKTIKIPALVSIEEYKENEKQINSICDGIRLIYAGSPGTKDLLVPVFEALKRINGLKELIRFDVYGISNEYAEKAWGSVSLYPGVHFHGRVDHDVIIDEVRNAHFTVLLRKRKRYAMAGYSTKATESMYLGTPIICNSVGGTDTDIVDGKMGFVLSDASSELLVELLNRILKMPEHEYLDMRKNTEDYAKEMYSGEKYKNDLLRFLDYE